VIIIMYERMLDKSSEPDGEQIREYIGGRGFALLTALEAHLQSRYDLSKELRFPFGGGYGWGYKYSHKTKHLCYAFFEKGAITVTIQIGTNDALKLDAQLPALLPKTRELWKNRYPCGDGGGWIHYRVMSGEELADVFGLIAVRKKPLV